MIYRLALPVFALALMTATANAQDRADTPRQIGASYSGSVLFLTVADIQLSASLQPDTYSAAAHFESAGLLAWFNDTNIDAGVSGYRNGRALQPWRYDHINHASKKGRTVGIDFPEGVATPRINPPFGSMGEPPASEAERNGALDPISAVFSLTLASQNSAQGVCTGTIAVFDGKARYDLRLENRGPDRVSTRAWRGDAILCQAYLEPVSGYDPGDRPTEDETSEPVSIWLAPIEDVYVPVRFRLKSSIGEINIKALSINVE
ncbi:DUF3108 domain-containing protein [Woodsholea maritima]|uniref:DUF3108 domain-containing protein n=1 Tax=Woodsholea maritima TaxID=240237 RepID=UPI00035C52C8|nr:DUF3108 domain-containing protein [Woodsholea maritima]